MPAALLRESVAEAFCNLAGIVAEDPERAKAAIATHIQKLVLRPGEMDGMPVYEVTDGEWNPMPDKDVTLVVARDGLEPPTPAFSGPRSTN